jgi:S-DNA-T family DNA segregation ATPase FtsK/SpoIIIE
MTADRFFSAKNSITRNISIAAAFALTGVAIVTAVFICAALVSGTPNGLGNFLLEAYGLFSLLIPAWFVWGAVVLWSPVFAPRSLFSLDASVAPFFTLTAGFSVTRDFARFAENSPLLTALGRNGFSLTMVVIALLEAVAIGTFAYKLFPKTFIRRKMPPQPRPRWQSVPQTADGEQSGGVVLPGPDFADDSGISAMYSEPFTVVREPVYAKMPLVRKPELPNPVDDIVLDADTGTAFDIINRARELRKTAGSLYAGEGDTVLPDLKISAPENFLLPECLRELPEELLPEDENASATLQTPAPALSDLDLVLNDLLADTSPAPEAAVSAGLGSLDAAVLDDTPVDQTGQAGELEALEEIVPAEDSIPPDETLEAMPADYESRESHESYESLAVLPLENKAEAVLDEEDGPFAMLDEENEEDGRLPERALPAVPAPSAAYAVPIDGILKEYPDDRYWVIDNATRDAAKVLKDTLSEFNIEADVIGIRKGPVITMFEVLPAPGVKLSRIVNLQDNIAMRLAAESVRIVAPIPGKHAVGIEIPNIKRNIVSFRELIDGELQRRAVDSGVKKPEIPVVLGKDIGGEAVTVDLASMPHLLIAGSTGSGKSVCVNTMILSLLYQCRPAECRLILIDPKIVELNLYNDIPHLLAPVITEPKKALQALQYCICEMERRYSCLDSMHVRDIKSYNTRIKEQAIAAEHMPYLVVVIDEFADLMATTGKELETTVARLTAKSRAVGIHLVLATQRPSTDVITGLIKSNVPSRIAFMVASQIDSRIIIDTTGAEKLLGKGDMLYSGVVSPFPVRMQGAFVSEEEVERVVDYVKTLGAPDYIEDEMFFDDDDEAEGDLFEGAEDPLYERAAEIVCQQGRASASYIQRRLKIGYNRAARLVEIMEARGIVGPAQGSKPRELLRAV